MICLKCGAFNNEGAAFCTACGDDLSAAQPSTIAIKPDTLNTADTIDSVPPVSNAPSVADTFSQGGEMPSVGSSSNQPRAIVMPMPTATGGSGASGSQVNVGSLPPQAPSPIPSQNGYNNNNNNNNSYNNNNNGYNNNGGNLNGASYRPYQNNQDLEPVMAVKDWIITFLIFAVPIVGIIMMFVWAFGSEANRNKANFCKAQLIMTAIIIGIYIIFGGVMVAIFGSVIGSLLEMQI